MLEIIGCSVLAVVLFSFFFAMKMQIVVLGYVQQNEFEEVRTENTDHFFCSLCEKDPS